MFHLIAVKRAINGEQTIDPVYLAATLIDLLVTFLHVSPKFRSEFTVNDLIPLVGLEVSRIFMLAVNIYGISLATISYDYDSRWRGILHLASTRLICL